MGYLQSVPGPSCPYNIELVGRGHDLKRLKNAILWEGLLSKATLVGHHEGQNTVSSIGKMHSSEKGDSCLRPQRSHGMSR